MNILIIGTGQLGSRYLQGLAVCSALLEIWGFDPSLDSPKTSKERWENVGGSSSIHGIHWTQDCSELKGLDPEVEYSIEKDWLPTWIHSHRIFGLRPDQAFHDIGTSERYREIQSQL